MVISIFIFYYWKEEWYNEVMPILFMRLNISRNFGLSAQRFGLDIGILLL